MRCLRGIMVLCHSMKSYHRTERIRRRGDLLSVPCCEIVVAETLKGVVGANLLPLITHTLCKILQ